MTTYSIETSIDAPAATVWAVLTTTLPKNPKPFGILKLDGTIAPNARLKLWSEVTPERAFTLRIVQFNAPRKMVWRGGMPFGLFTGTRTFTVSPEPDGTRFQMQETFTGPLAGMITRTMPDLTPSFEKFAQTLKTMAEQS